jgi:hypothetical protein
MKSSAHTELNGVTVLEPMILNDPIKVDAAALLVVAAGVVVVAAPVHPEIIVMISTTASGMSHLILAVCKLIISLCYIPMVPKRFIHLYPLRSMQADL